MPEAIVVLSLLCTGLYAGYMLSFRSGVMPALRELTDEQFTEAMRRINEKVPGPLFLLLFLGSIGFPAVSLLVAVEGRTGAQQAMAAVGLACAVVGHLVTAAGNVPLNHALAAAADAQGGAHTARTAFEQRWNTLHGVRTVPAVAAFALLLAAAV